MVFTGSTRKLFSTAAAFTALGADGRQTTTVHRSGEVAGTTLDGDLVLVAGGDLTFGGRRIDADTVEYTNLDHNDANNLGAAELTPQDPLFGLDQLAAQVKASGIDTVSGDVVVDARFFEPYRVPNGNLLITPMMVNENQVDISVTPTDAGQPATRGVPTQDRGLHRRRHGRDRRAPEPRPPSSCPAPREPSPRRGRSG